MFEHGDFPKKQKYNVCFFATTSLFWLNPIQDGIFRGVLHILGDKKSSSPPYTYPTMMKVDTVILCLKNIEKNTNPVKQSLSSTEIIFSVLILENK